MFSQAWSIESISSIQTAIAEIEKALSEMGVNTATSSRASYDKLLELPEEELKKRIARLQLIRSALKERKVATSGTAEADNLKRVLDGLKLSAKVDLTKIIKKGVIIEIYDPSGFQLYHNLEWLQYSSYSVLDVLAYPFSELFERPSFVTQRIWQYGLDMLSAEDPKARKMNIPPHIVRECLAPDARYFLVKFEYMAPLFGEDGRAQAVLVTQRIQPIEKDFSEHLVFI